MRVVVLALFAVVCLLACGNTVDPADPAATISLRFNGPAYQGNYYASTVLVPTDNVVWIENANREFVKTLRLSKGIPGIGAGSAHLEHVPTWTTKADADTLVPDAAYDGITGASPKFSATLSDTTVVAQWDLTDTTGTRVADGTYYFCAEVANIAKDSASVAPGYTESINAECTCGTLVLPAGPVTPAQTTAHIQELSASLIN